jgi:hypothetical protein
MNDFSAESILKFLSTQSNLSLSDKLKALGSENDHLPELTENVEEIFQQFPIVPSNFFQLLKEYPVGLYYWTLTKLSSRVYIPYPNGIQAFDNFWNKLQVSSNKIDDCWTFPDSIDTFFRITFSSSGTEACSWLLKCGEPLDSLYLRYLLVNATISVLPVSLLNFGNLENSRYVIAFNIQSFSAPYNRISLKYQNPHLLPTVKITFSFPQVPAEDILESGTLDTIRSLVFSADAFRNEVMSCLTNDTYSLSPSAKAFERSIKQAITKKFIDEFQGKALSFGGKEWRLLSCNIAGAIEHSYIYSCIRDKIVQEGVVKLEEMDAGNDKPMILPLKLAQFNSTCVEIVLPQNIQIDFIEDLKVGNELLTDGSGLISSDVAEMIFEKYKTGWFCRYGNNKLGLLENPFDQYEKIDYREFVVENDINTKQSNWPSANLPPFPVKQQNKVSSEVNVGDNVGGPRRVDHDSSFSSDSGTVPGSTATNNSTSNANSGSDDTKTGSSPSNTKSASSSDGLSCPCAFQIRYQGCKGVLVVDPSLPTNTIKFRNSMKKFESFFDSQLFIIGVALHRDVILSAELINAFDANANNTENLFQYLGRELIINRKDYQDRDVFSYVSNSFNNGNFDLLPNSILRLNVPLHHSAKVYGVADFSRTLKANEVFLSLDECDNQMDSFSSDNCDIIVGKTPVLLPDDLCRFKLVRNCEPLNHLKNVLVFSTNCDFFPTKQVTNADLDGDQFYCLWNSDLLSILNKVPQAKRSERIEENEEHFNQQKGTEQHHDHSNHENKQQQQEKDDHLQKLEESSPSLAERSKRQRPESYGYRHGQLRFIVNKGSKDERDSSPGQQKSSQEISPEKDINTPDNQGVQRRFSTDDSDRNDTTNINDEDSDKYDSPTMLQKIQDLGFNTISFIKNKPKEIAQDLGLQGSTEKEQQDEKQQQQEGKSEYQPYKEVLEDGKERKEELSATVGTSSSSNVLDQVKINELFNNAEKSLFSSLSCFDYCNLDHLLSLRLRFVDYYGSQWGKETLPRRISDWILQTIDAPKHGKWITWGTINAILCALSPADGLPSMPYYDSRSLTCNNFPSFSLFSKLYSEMFLVLFNVNPESNALDARLTMELLVRSKFFYDLKTKQDINVKKLGSFFTSDKEKFLTDFNQKRFSNSQQVFESLISFPFVEMMSLSPLTVLHYLNVPESSATVMVDNDESFPPPLSTPSSLPASRDFIKSPGQPAALTPISATFDHTLSFPHKVGEALAKSADLSTLMKADNEMLFSPTKIICFSLFMMVSGLLFLKQLMY